MKKIKINRQKARERRHRRVRAKIKGTSLRPRLCVFRSLKHIYAQIIDDEKGTTQVAASDLELQKNKSNLDKLNISKKIEGIKMTRKVQLAYLVGKLIAKKAIEKKIRKVVFDRGGYKYHGRVKALAEGAREGGLEF